ncbi:DinB family protein [Parapedobacter defluvii]|uniref:DinB family protein n=1 Tax=Parapedobacter defluvii TaxID=2045106 RepID=UPI003342000D
MINVEELLTELSGLTQQHIRAVQSFKELPQELLNRKPAAGGWNILECVEHLNRYGDFYIPEIERCIRNAKCRPSAVFKPGLLGNYFAKSMLPKERMNKMKTFKSMDPADSPLDLSVLDKFIHQQEQLLQLLEVSRQTDLTGVKTSISISKWIKLRLGDTLRVVVYHNLRHVAQAQKLG